MDIFKTKLFVEIGLSCDCCVKVLSVETNVFATSKRHAKDLLYSFYPLAAIKIQSMENKGAAEEVSSPGVIVESSAEIFQGCHKDSPLYDKQPCSQGGI